jgi:hypothetical protein
MDRFNALFGELKPHEQVELIKLFVKEIGYDGLNKEIKIFLRPLPALSLEVDEGGHLSKLVQMPSPIPMVIEL